jgi:hypothetical protein
LYNRTTISKISISTGNTTPFDIETISRTEISTNTFISIENHSSIQYIIQNIIYTSFEITVLRTRTYIQSLPNHPVLQVLSDLHTLERCPQRCSVTS